MGIKVIEQNMLTELAQRFATLSSLLINQPNDGYIQQLKDHYIGANFSEDKELKSYLNKSSVEELTLELAKEWTLLFRGLSPTYGPKPPYIGVYSSGDGVGIDTLLELTALYKSHGLEADESNRDRLDYLAYSFDFIGYLLSRITTTGEDDKKQWYIDELGRYLNKFIVPWIDRYIAKASEHAKSPFYLELLNEILSCINLAREIADN